MVQQGEKRKQAQSVAKLLELFIGPLEGWLDDQLDWRLVRTFFLALAAMVRLRHSRSGLLLSELGCHILSPDPAPAGTKRLSNLLRSPQWSHTILERFLWYKADQARDELNKAGETPRPFGTRVSWNQVGLECPLALLPSHLLHLYPKFGMTHVFRAIAFWITGYPSFLRRAIAF